MATSQPSKVPKMRRTIRGGQRGGYDLLNVFFLAESPFRTSREPQLCFFTMASQRCAVVSVGKTPHRFASCVKICGIRCRDVSLLDLIRLCIKLQICLCMSALHGPGPGPRPGAWSRVGCPSSSCSPNLAPSCPGLGPGLGPAAAGSTILA